MEQSDQAKLDEIRKRARLESAQKAQADAVAIRREAKTKESPFTLGHLVLALVAIVGLSWVYMAKEPDKPDTYQQDLERLTAATREYEDKAFKVAAIRQLRQAGILISDPESMESGRLSGDIYSATFTVDGQRHQLRGQYICSQEGLMQDERQKPACYLWR